MSHQVFISHSTKDKQVADAVCHALEASGIRCWIAPRDIGVGQSWKVAIEEAIETCEVFVLVFSQHVNDSKAVRDEIYLASDENNRVIIPYKIDEATWGSGLKSLGRLHWLDAYPDWESKFGSLEEQVKRNLSVDLTKHESHVAPVVEPNEDEDQNDSGSRTKWIENIDNARKSKVGNLLLSAVEKAARAATVEQESLVAKPSWAETTGKDQYGQYADLVFKGIRQCFRYIEPGEFMMGSPEDEPERGDDETQHKVQLTNGYWMADTACTQEMWEAVVGSNPSGFKGDNLPVENVSWEDISNNFLASLRQQTGDKVLGYQ